ncbi:MAG: NAD(P)/FAD-dependent oxidoreductase [Armatimonadetes bacterium]|nr:NAD(P)/FAD-dependent oxidoreductase [Armatimonadota bacterium]
MKTFTYAIIGNSVAAIGAIEAIRSVDRTGSIGLFSDEPHHVYSRPLITHYLAGEVSEEKMLYRPPDFYERYGVQAFLGAQVESVEFENRRLQTAGGESAFEKLLISVGGRPIVPKIAGGDLRGVFTMNTWDDAREMKSYLPAVRSAMVLGGGLTGLKTAEALVEAGVRVTVVELAERVLSMLLDRRSAEVVVKQFENQGTRILTGTTISEIRGGECVESASLSDGSTAECQMVVLAIGVTPRLDLVQDTPVRTNRGIFVDRRMETSVPGVFAAGDVAEAYDALLDQNRVLPVLPNAYAGGRVAGLNMAGGERTYDLGASVNSTTFFGYPVVSAGSSAIEEGAEIIEGDDENGYRRFIIQDDRLTGFVMTGEVNRAGIVLDLVRERIPLNGLKDRLLDGIGLIDLPEEIRHKKLRGGTCCHEKH